MVIGLLDYNVIRYKISLIILEKKLCATTKSRSLVLRPAAVRSALCFRRIHADAARMRGQHHHVPPSLSLA